MRHRRSLSYLATATLAAGVLVGCGSDDTDAPGADGSPTGNATATTDDGLLAEYGFEGMDAREIIEQIDQAEDRPADLMASVRYDELLVSDPSEPGQEIAMPIEDEFYLSMAPYVDSTHDCFYHSLTTCQGELVEEELDVTITDSEGQVLVEDTVTTYPNGFVGFWLPREIQATVEVSYDGRTATAEIGTGEEDKTCLTTMQLT